MLSSVADSGVFTAPTVIVGSVLPVALSICFVHFEVLFCGA